LLGAYCNVPLLVYCVACVPREKVMRESKLPLRKFSSKEGRRPPPEVKDGIVPSPKATPFRRPTP
jgi:hypothetical protein